MGWILALLLCGCGGETPPETTAEPTTAPACYQITLSVGEESRTQTVIKGELPQAGAEAPEGMRIGGWTDETGVQVDPFRIPAAGDASYSAVLYPDFGNHAPYLFVDENGFVHPDDPLTREALAAALQALAPSEEVYESIALPEEETVTAEDLRSVLDGYFPAAELDAAFADGAEGELTRLAFAQRMNALLGRHSGEILVFLHAQPVPKDLDLEDPLMGDLLEAVLAHKTSELGSPMAEAVYKMPWIPGYHMNCGYTYYADENGDLLMDGMLGDLYFGPDGRYTCGDGELDATVAQVLFGIVKAAPDKGRDDWLYDAFEYSRDNFWYAGKLILDVGATGWEEEAAKEMFAKGHGNCYHYAAVYCVLARGLGYEAEGVSGLAMELVEPHGWVSMEFDGEVFIFDPQTAMVALTGRRTNWGEDMFMVPDWDWDA